MIGVYSALIAMLLLAVAIVGIAFRGQLTKGFWLTVTLLLTAAFGLFHISNNLSGVQEWRAQGKMHYDLLVTFQDLGGFDGTIIRIKEKLKQHPNDAHGWDILGKLYSAKGDDKAAEAAFAKARALQLRK